MVVPGAGAATGPALAVNGLISGITTPKVISALLAGYQEPITRWTDQRGALAAQAAEYRKLSTDFQAVLTAAQSLSTPAAWDLAAATSSDTSVATATASAGAATGSLSVTVNQLAQANLLVSSNGVSSQGTVVTATPSLLVETGGAALGFSSLGAGTGLPTGTYALTVTQASQAATASGSAALGASVGVTATHDTIALTVGGTAATLVLAAGTYTPGALVTAIDAAASSAGVGISASIASTGALRLATTAQGSAATLAVSGGTALTALHLHAGATATGTDAVVTVDGTKTTLTSVVAGQAVTLSAPSTRTLDATIATAPGPGGSLVSTGTAHAAEVSTGNGTIGEVATAINESGLALTASTVTRETGSIVLQVSAGGTGAAGAVGLDPAAFTGSPLGSMGTVQAARTATVSVGGAGGYTLASPTDTFTGLLPGTSVTVASVGTATISVQPDATGEASKVSSLVTAVNSALADIQRYAGYTASAKSGGPLMGSAVVEGVKQAVLSTIAAISGTSSLGNLSDAGISLTKTGTVTFTRGAFLHAFQAGPTAVRALFVQGGTYAPAAGVSQSAVRFVGAGTQTAAGTYAVVVSRSAAQAVDTGATLPTRAVSAAETLRVTMGSTTVTYTTSAGESLTSVASGLNAAFGGASLGITASVAGTHLALTSDAYGAGATFSVESTASGTGTTGLGGASAGTVRTVSGTDVAGTIGGLSANGTGRVLSAPAGAPLDGLSVQVTAQGITTATTLGTVAYAPGAAQRLATIMQGAANATTGSITEAIKSLSSQETGLTSQIAMYTRLESEQRAVLQQQFVSMETTLGKLKNESSTLQSQLGSLPGL